ncbi:Fused nickel transport protein NikMN [uncultured bacterium]|nr:Fused nickel transport protein NikMN [uncultured bacterium]
MHIPDGYLSPATCAVFYGVMAPAWYLASKKTEKTLGVKGLPLMALGAAFTFVIQMFNFPVPGGTSGHMAGGAVLGIVLGPWAAIMAMSLTLGLQALFFGDGGILAFGANCFNMALVMPVSAYVVFKVVASGEAGAFRRFFGAALAAYIAVNLAALATGIELGLQPLIAHTAEGRALYAPYPLNIAVPAMALPHLLFFGVVEALATAMVVSYVLKMGIFVEAGRKASLRPLLVFVGVLIALVPIGLIAAGTPWGEWGKEELGQLLGYVPSGVERFEGAWKGVLPDYGQGSGRKALLYVLSALGGSVLLVAVVYAWSRLWKK